MKNIVLMLCFISIGCLQAQAQDSTKHTIKNKLDARHFTFVPTSITPARGGTKQLTGGYIFKISGDTLKVYLPYFGRAYSAPINSSDAGFDFTSTNFTYAVTAGKKGRYNVAVKTKDKMYNTDFLLTVYDDGSAYLNANNSNRDPVSYNGNVKIK